MKMRFQPLHTLPVLETPPTLQQMVPVGTVEEGYQQTTLEDVQTTLLATVNSRLASLEAGGGGGGAGAAGSIMIQAGDLQATNPIPVGFAVQGLATIGYNLTGWDLWVYPVGSLTLDVRRCALEQLPMQPSHSMTPSVKPELVNAETVSGDVAGWASTDIAVSNALALVVTANTGVKWFTLLLKGTKT